MINGLGVLGWGVGGIEAEAAMLGQPMFLPQPIVIGVRTIGELPAGTTATDLVLTLTEMLRAHGVVGKFVEFFGDGLSSLSIADRATLSNMCPEYGATSSYFPIDDETLRYLSFTGRGDRVDLVERYAKEQGLFRRDGDAEPTFTEILDLDLSAVVPSMAGPKRPQDRVPLPDIWDSFVGAFRDHLEPDPKGTEIGRFVAEGGTPRNDELPGEDDVTDRPAGETSIGHGSVVIAAITSCTNTSNPSVMLAAGLLARKAVEAGLDVKPWVKTSLAPGSRVVTDYLDRAGLTPYLDKLGFALVGLRMHDLHRELRPADRRGRGGGRRARTSTSSPCSRATGTSRDGCTRRCGPPTSRRRRCASRTRSRAASTSTSPPSRSAAAPRGRSSCATSGRAPTRCATPWRPRSPRNSSRRSTDASGTATSTGKGCRPRPGPVYDWRADSTYVQEPPFFAGLGAGGPVGDIEGARVLVKVGDSITTDHISPAGSIKLDSPAGRLSARAGGRAGRLQLLRVEARQPRGDDAGHLREHPAAQRDGCPAPRDRSRPTCRAAR